MKDTRVFIEGSYFCQKCNLEYNGKGTCKCGGEIKFLSMHDYSYLTVWMKSRKVTKEDEKMDEKIQDMVSAYFTLEEIILEKISKLPMYGKDCNCGEPDCCEPNRFSIVDGDIMVSYCLNCGGNISW
jgi:hypothetical protein